MKIKYLGTAASEAIPALGCTCDVCKQARLLKGKEFRSRSSMLVNDNLLIDFNSDTNSNFAKFDLDFNKVNNLLITHSHTDHLYPEELDNLRANFIKGYSTLDVFSGKSGYKLVKKVANRRYLRNIIKVNLVKPFKEIAILDYKIVPLIAKHDNKSSPFIYLIEQGGKKMLYANDTGDILKENYEAIRQFGKLDLVSFDCTIGYLCIKRTPRHMGLDQVVNIINDFKKEGFIDNNTINVITHFSHNGGSTHSEIENEASKYNIITAYDGLEIDF